MSAGSQATSLSIPWEWPRHNEWQAKAICTDHQQHKVCQTSVTPDKTCWAMCHGNDLDTTCDKPRQVFEQTTNSTRFVKLQLITTDKSCWAMHHGNDPEKTYDKPGKFLNRPPTVQGLSNFRQYLMSHIAWEQGLRRV